MLHLKKCNIDGIYCSKFLICGINNTEVNKYFSRIKNQVYETYCNE